MDKNLDLSSFTKELINDEIFESFKKEFPKYNNYSNKELYLVWKQMMNDVCELIVNEDDGVMLHNNLGDFHIRLINKPLKKYIPVNQEYELMNWNTDRKPAKIIWSINSARKGNRRLHFFKFEAGSFLKSKTVRNLKKSGTNYKDITLKSKFIK